GLEIDKRKNILQHGEYSAGSSMRKSIDQEESLPAITRDRTGWSERRQDDSDRARSEIYEICHSLRNLCSELSLGSNSFIKTIVIKILNSDTTTSDILQLLSDSDVSMQIKLAAAEFKSQEEICSGYKKSQYNQAYMQTKLLIDYVKKRGPGDYDNKTSYNQVISNKEGFLYGLNLKELASVTQKMGHEFTKKLI
ncbi:unnamed protein product, partial [Meganyctiphanes norvegica]